MAGASDYSGYGEKVGEYRPGNWGESTVNGVMAVEEIEGIVDGVLADFGRTKVVSISRDGNGKLKREFYAQPPLDDPNEALAAGTEIRNRWEDSIANSLQALSTDQVGNFEPGQLSELYKAIEEIKTNSPNCAIAASGV